MHIKPFSNTYLYFQRAYLDIQLVITCSKLTIETLEQGINFEDI